MPQLFQDRRDAGRVLAGLLEHYANRGDVVVLALPRGGVPVAFEVATALNAPLDVFLVRKLGVPGGEELAMGAIADGGVVVLNEDVVAGLGIESEIIRNVAVREGRELARREHLGPANEADAQARGSARTSARISLLRGWVPERIGGLRQRGFLARRSRFVQPGVHRLLRKEIIEETSDVLFDQPWWNGRAPIPSVQAEFGAG